MSALRLFDGSTDPLPNRLAPVTVNLSEDPQVRIFGDFADEYDQYRPGYPEGLWEKLLEGNPHLRVADLGSGTGIAAIELARRGARVTAVEPDSGMRGEALEAATRAGISLQVVGGNGEETSLKDGCCELVTSAQAFHWFATQKALTEIDRILVPGGRLGIWWNERNVLEVPYMEAFERMIKRYNSRYRREYRVRDWSRILRRFRLPQAFAPGFEVLEESVKRYNPFFRDRYSLHDWSPLLHQSGRFASVGVHAFDYSMECDLERFLGYAFTLPFVRKEIDESKHAQFRDELREVLKKHHGDNAFPVEFTTWLYLCRK